MIRFDTPRFSLAATGPALLLLATGCAGKTDTRAELPPPPPPVPTPVTQVQGPAGVIHVDDGGTGGVPVVFLHSFAGSTAHWSAQLMHLRATRRAVALDFRGHGQSAAASNNDYSVESLARDVAAVVDTLGLGRFVLVGHSQGGSAAIAYAAAHPDRVAGLVMVGTPGKVPDAQAAQVIAALETSYDKTMGAYWDKLLTGAQPEVKTRIAAERNAVPKDASVSLIKALFAFDPLPPLTSYAGPRLIISTDGSNTPNDLQNLAPGVPHKAIAGTSHWPQLDKPEEFNVMLDEFLATIP